MSLGRCQYEVTGVALAPDVNGAVTSHLELCVSVDTCNYGLLTLCYFSHPAVKRVYVLHVISFQVR